MSRRSATSILVVAAHPDDEILGVGGTAARHAAAGETVSVYIAATGATSRVDHGGSAEIDALREAAREAARLLGTEPPRFGGFPDQRLDTIPLLDLTQTIERLVAEVQPRIVYTHSGRDLNKDHEILTRAVLTATRPMPGSTVEAVYAFETVSSSEWSADAEWRAFSPNHFVDIAATLPQKVAALEAYASEMRPFPHARSIQAVTALAQTRGAAVGLAAAEAFSVIRQVRR